MGCGDAVSVTGQTHLGRLRLSDGSDLLVAGRSALGAGLDADPFFAQQISRWVEPPMSLRAWAQANGPNDPALDLALHVDDEVAFVAARAPAPDHDPACPIPRLFDPFETPETPRLHLSPAEPEDGPLTLLMDGAALPALPDRLEASGVPRICLFDGPAADDLGDAAPWLTQMPLSDPLAREAVAGRACLGFAGVETLRGLKAQLRYSTKLQKSDGTWVYFRMCDPAFHEWIALHPAGPLPKNLLAEGQALWVLEPSGAWRRAERRAGEPPVRHAGFLDVFTRFARTRLRRRFLARAIPALSGQLGIEIGLGQAARQYREAKDEGYFRERALIRRMEAGLRMEAAGSTVAALATAPEMVAMETASDVHRAGALLALARGHVGVIV
ncbi:MAG: DUF4123 domain-containing protein [Pseudomonadota bacterium]